MSSFHNTHTFIFFTKKKIHLDLLCVAQAELANPLLSNVLQVQCGVQLLLPPLGQLVRVYMVHPDARVRHRTLAKTALGRALPFRHNTIHKIATTTVFVYPCLDLYSRIFSHKYYAQNTYEKDISKFAALLMPKKRASATFSEQRATQTTRY
jgi:hypothetical protein